MIKTTLKIDGMMCGMCEAHVNDTIRKNCQVKKVKSSAKKGETIIISEDKLNKELLTGIMAELGYILVESKSELYKNKGFFSIIKQ